MELDEDFEVSNKLVDEYLVQHDPTYNQYVSDQFSPESPTVEPRQPTTTQKHITNTRFNIFSYFFNKHVVRNILESNKLILNETVDTTDQSLIIEMYVKFLDQFEPSGRSVFRRFVFVFLMGLICVTFGFLYIPVFVLLIVILIVKLTITIFDISLSKWLNLASTYLFYLKNTLSFLKEAELVSLSVERKYLIERKIKPVSSNPFDGLNFEFRRQLFFKLRSEFYELRRINTYLNSSTKLEDLISSVEEADLADVLKPEETQLEEKTDQFSLACLKILAKLVRVVLSENYRVIFAAYFQMFSVNCSLSTIFKFVIMAVKIVIHLRKSVNELKTFEDVLNLNQLLNDIPVTTKKTSSNQIDSSSIKSLRMYLRNACLQSNLLDSSSITPESLKLVKSSLEYCEFYLKQLMLSVEQPVKNDQDSNRIDLRETRQQTPPEIPTEVPMPQIEDEIFEEDLSKTKTENEKGNDCLDFAELCERKQVELANKNLFYELKFALKFKSNEWRQREKLAKKRAGRAEGVDDEHLLENEAMKYKSELRRRRREVGSKRVIEESSTRKKYVFVEDEHHDELIERPQAGFFNELINKAILLEHDKEETFEF